MLIIVGWILFQLSPPIWIWILFGAVVTLRIVKVIQDNER